MHLHRALLPTDPAAEETNTDLSASAPIVNSPGHHKAQIRRSPGKRNVQVSASVLNVQNCGRRNQDRIKYISTERERTRPAEETSTEVSTSVPSVN